MAGRIMDTVDFQLPAGARRIVVAMSGGVDSSVVAALAQASGAETIGVTLQLYDHGEATKRAGACCAGRDIRDARAVCDRLGIAHYVFDHESSFRTQVVDRFADEYLAGRTPVPCVQCNMGPKFTDLFALARDLGADCLATGHYVRRILGSDGAQLHRAIDPARDQSYFLFATTRAQLDFLRFPLGALPKRRVRELAGEMGLLVADKPDSQDICFVPDGDYATLVKKLRPEADDQGAIVHVDGTARVQTVREETNPTLYRLLKEFDALTGVPVLINTSFNVKGEPIIETPRDAVICFLTTGIDHLVMHDTLVSKNAMHKIVGPLVNTYTDIATMVMANMKPA